MGVVKRSCLDHNQDDQECGAGQQVTPFVDLISTAEKSQSQIETAAAAGRGHPLCRKVAENGPQKQKRLQEA